ncbi:MAG: sugar phosphate nucleotidyltransferase [Candidatus Hydrogenedentota bacterium]
MKEDRWVIILAGGCGERLWPLSTKRRPKHLIPIIRQFQNSLKPLPLKTNHLKNNTTLLEETFNRTSQVIPDDRILIVTKKEQYPLIKNCFRKNITIIKEPIGKNTFPAILSGVQWIINHSDENQLISVFSADQFISPLHKFISCILRSFRYLQNNNNILLWGIKPDRPSTNFGYIKTYHNKSRATPSFLDVAGFIEKPDIKKAKKFISQKNYFFNAGIFFFKANVFLNEAIILYPDLSLLLPKLYTSISSTAPVLEVYQKFPTISIDYALLEKIRNLKCLPVNFYWNDVGSLDDFVNLFAKQTRLITYNSKNIAAYSESGHIISAFNINDIIIIESNGKIFVADRKSLKEIRGFYKFLSTNASVPQSIL